MVLYLDDGLGKAQSRSDCLLMSSFARQSLLQAGLLVNEEKFIFELVHSLDWLGLIWNAVDFLSLFQRGE